MTPWHGPGDSVKKEMNMKKLLSLTMLVLTFAGVNSFALSMDDVIIREMNAKSAAKLVDYNDSTLLNIYYTGSSTEAVVEVSSGLLKTYTPIGTADLSYDLGYASYDTLGELCDVIEAEDYYECTLTGGKRDDSSLLLDFVTAAAATDAKASGGYSIKLDTGGVVETDPYDMRIGITPASGKRVVLKHCGYDSKTDADILQVYGKLAIYDGNGDGITRNDTTLVWALSQGNNDATLYAPANAAYDGGASWLEFAKDEHVVIVLSGTVAQDSDDWMYCTWEEK